MPASDRFGPLDQPVNPENCVVMSVDEYETIRLIDLQGFTQEESAEQMNIARPTVQRIYNDARQKLADSLVNSRVLRIEGGDYQLCEGLEEVCRCGGCHRHRMGWKAREKEGLDKKVLSEPDHKP